MEQAQLEKNIAEAMKKHAQKAWWKDNASTTHLNEQGDIGYERHGNVCHNHMNNHGFKYVINGIHHTGEDYNASNGRYLPPEVELWFVDYIINRSPYSETFISKDAAKCLEDKVTLSSGDHPSNLMVAGLVALRRLWEYSMVARAAYDLAQAGVNEDLAFVLGHLVSVESKVDANSVTGWGYCHSGHCSINPGLMGFKVLKRFLAHEPKYLNPLWSKGKGQYDGYDRMYGEEHPAITGYVRDNFPYHLYKDKPAPAVVSTNPFLAAKAKPAIGKNKDEYAPYSRAIEVMAEWAKTHLMEKIRNA